MQRHREPRPRNHRIHPPPPILPLIHLPYPRHSLLLIRPRRPLHLQILRLARQPQEIARHPRKPEAICDRIQAGRPLTHVLGPRRPIHRRDERLWDNPVISQHAYVFQHLVCEVRGRLREGNAVQDGVGAGFGAGG